MEAILRKLIAFPSVSSDQAANQALLDYVAAFLQARDLHVTRYEWGGFGSLVATVKAGQKRPKVMLATHADVVPGAGRDFTLRKKAGRYHGRGVLDMKFALAAYMQIVDELHRQGTLHTFDLGIMVTTDEEVGGRNGVAKLVEEGYIPQVCVLPDGGDNWQVQTSSKGLWLFKVVARGRTAHGSRPWLGDNAITKLFDGLQEIRALFPEHLHPDTNTITLSQFNGGEAINQVPETASMMIDIRTTDSAEHSRIYDAVVKICHKHGLEYDYVGDAAPTSFSLEDPLIAPFVSLITEVTGRKVTGHHAMGASDVRFYVPFGVPCISVYPLGGGLHGPYEWLDIEALQHFKVITRRYLEQIAQQPAVKPAAPLLTQAA